MTNYCNIRLEVSGPSDEVGRFEANHLGEDGDGEVGFFQRVLPPPAKLDDDLRWRLNVWGCLSDAVGVRASMYTPGSGTHTVFFSVSGGYPIGIFRALEALYPKVGFWVAYEQEGDGYGGIGRATRPIHVMNSDNIINQVDGREPLSHVSYCPYCGRC